jgi:hypothetical protein
MALLQTLGRANFSCEYSDKDREDMDREEFEYAMELYIEQTLEKTKSKTRTKVDSGSDEDESYRPSPEVCPTHTMTLLL